MSDGNEFSTYIEENEDGTFNAVIRLNDLPNEETALRMLVIYRLAITGVLDGFNASHVNDKLKVN